MIDLVLTSRHATFVYVKRRVVFMYIRKGGREEGKFSRRKLGCIISLLQHRSMTSIIPAFVSPSPADP